MKKLLIFSMMLSLLFIGGCRGKEQVEKGTEPEPIPQENQVVEEPKNPELPGAFLVMIDNHNKARPQSGLEHADLVYEILAEGGITRYLGIFYHEKAEKIGPVRSARYYFVQLAKGYNAPYAHAGGNQDALAMIVNLKIKDIDEIYNAGSYFWRDKKRKMPHNLYTSTDLLIKGAKNRGLELTPLKGFLQGTNINEKPHEKDIELNYSIGRYSYIVSWHFNGKQYERKINQAPHLMENKALIVADNVFVLTAKTREVIKEELESEIELIGKGSALYFVEGKYTKGYWEKKSATAEMNFFTEEGQPIKAKSGKTWIQVIPQMDCLTY